MSELTDQRLATSAFDRFGPVVCNRDLSAAGVPRRVFVRLETAGLVTRIGKSAFARTDELLAAEPWEAFRLRSIGFALCAADDVHLTAASAAAVLGIPMLDEPPTFPMALRPGNGHRGTDRSPYGRVRTGVLAGQHRWVRARVRTVSSAFAAIEVARRSAPPGALVAVDHVMHQGVSRDDLSRIVRDLHRYPGIEAAEWAVRYADPRSESPVETLGRLAFLEAGRTPPLSNVWITDRYRAVRVDHLFPESGVVLEGDGAVKYDDRPDAHRIVEAEKDRQRWLTGHGYSVERYDYATARHRPRELLWRVDQAVRLRAGRPVPSNWRLTAPDFEDDHRTA